MDIICTICTEPLWRATTVVATACGHLYHRACARRWLEKHSSCPYCRQSATLSALVPVKFAWIDPDTEQSSTQQEQDEPMWFPDANDPRSEAGRCFDFLLERAIKARWQLQSLRMQKDALEQQNKPSGGKDTQGSGRRQEKDMHEPADGGSGGTGGEKRKRKRISESSEGSS